MPTFAHDTFVVFDMPTANWTNGIVELRRRYDPDRAELPIEITVIGSSGVGVFENDQDQAQTFAMLNQVAARLAPITFSFQTIERFPGTNLFYLATDKPELFAQVQAQIVSTGLRFKSSPFPFTPHCTIAALTADDLETGDREIRNMPLPTEPITLHEMRVYSLDHLDCRRLYQTNLRGGA